MTLKSMPEYGQNVLGIEQLSEHCLKKLTKGPADQILKEQTPPANTITDDLDHVGGEN